MLGSREGLSMEVQRLCTLICPILRPAQDDFLGVVGATSHSELACPERSRTGGIWTTTRESQLPEAQVSGIRECGEQQRSH
jgi:hypothetical protein